MYSIDYLLWQRPEPTCLDGIKNGNETGVDCGGDCTPCYEVGGQGQANGIIIYDKGAYTDGWRYIEVASEDDPNSTCFLSNTFTTSLNTDNNIGTGKANTQYLINATGTNWNFASSYSLNGKSDWFVPSKDELKLIYEMKSSIPNLILTVGECKSYWCSTLEQLPNDKWTPTVASMTNGVFGFTNPGQRVRFIRYF
ncbi:MAG: hypothetical protein KDC04_04135 [Saprospiraceae bacterium]|nr:hypothetical protein [Saprospiraceae bacterium]MCB9308937.1 hypothetical protein [Lewinellaceae bacterium]